MAETPWEQFKRATKKDPAEEQTVQPNQGLKWIGDLMKSPDPKQAMRGLDELQKQLAAPPGEYKSTSDSLYPAMAPAIRAAEAVTAPVPVKEQTTRLQQAVKDAPAKPMAPVAPTVIDQEALFNIQATLEPLKKPTPAATALTQTPKVMINAVTQALFNKDVVGLDKLEQEVVEPLPPPPAAPPKSSQETRELLDVLAANAVHPVWKHPMTAAQWQQYLSTPYQGKDGELRKPFLVGTEDVERVIQDIEIGAKPSGGELSVTPLPWVEEFPGYDYENTDAVVPEFISVYDDNGQIKVGTLDEAAQVKSQLARTGKSYGQASFSELPKEWQSALYDQTLLRQASEELGIAPEDLGDGDAPAVLEPSINPLSGLPNLGAPGILESSLAANPWFLASQAARGLSVGLKGTGADSMGNELRRRAEEEGEGSEAWAAWQEYMAPETDFASRMFSALTGERPPEFKDAAGRPVALRGPAVGIANIVAGFSRLAASPGDVFTVETLERANERLMERLNTKYKGSWTDAIVESLGVENIAKGAMAMAGPLLMPVLMAYQFSDQATPEDAAAMAKDMAIDFATAAVADPVALVANPKAELAAGGAILSFATAKGALDMAFQPGQKAVRQVKGRVDTLAEQSGAAKDVLDTPGLVTEDDIARRWMEVHQDRAVQRATKDRALDDKFLETVRQETKVPPVPKREVLEELADRATTIRNLKVYTDIVDKSINKIPIYVSTLGAAAVFDGASKLFRHFAKNRPGWLQMGLKPSDLSPFLNQATRLAEYATNKEQYDHLLKVEAMKRAGADKALTPEQTARYNELRAKADGEKTKGTVTKAEKQELTDLERLRKEGVRTAAVEIADHLLGIGSGNTIDRNLLERFGRGVMATLVQARAPGEAIVAQPARPVLRTGAKSRPGTAWTRRAGQKTVTVDSTKPDSQLFDLEPDRTGSFSPEPELRPDRRGALAPSGFRGEVQNRPVEDTLFDVTHTMAERRKGTRSSALTKPARLRVLRAETPAGDQGAFTPGEPLPRGLAGFTPETQMHDAAKAQVKGEAPFDYQTPGAGERSAALGEEITARADRLMPLVGEVEVLASYGASPADIAKVLRDKHPGSKIEEMDVRALEREAQIPARPKNALADPGFLEWSKAVWARNNLQAPSIGKAPMDLRGLGTAYEKARGLPQTLDDLRVVIDDLGRAELQNMDGLLEAVSAAATQSPLTFAYAMKSQRKGQSTKVKFTGEPGITLFEDVARLSKMFRRIQANKDSGEIKASEVSSALKHAKRVEERLDATIRDFDALDKQLDGYLAKTPATVLPTTPEAREAFDPAFATPERMPGSEAYDRLLSRFDSRDNKDLVWDANAVNPESLYNRPGAYVPEPATFNQYAQRQQRALAEVSNLMADPRVTPEAKAAVGKALVKMAQARDAIDPTSVESVRKYGDLEEKALGELMHATQKLAAGEPSLVTSEFADRVYRAAVQAYNYSREQKKLLIKARKANADRPNIVQVLRFNNFEKDAPVLGPGARVGKWEMDPDVGAYLRQFVLTPEALKQASPDQIAKHQEASKILQQAEDHLVSLNAPEALDLATQFAMFKKAHQEHINELAKLPGYEGIRWALDDVVHLDTAYRKAEDAFAKAADKHFRAKTEQEKAVFKKQADDLRTQIDDDILPKLRQAQHEASKFGAVENAWTLPPVWARQDYLKRNTLRLKWKALTRRGTPEGQAASKLLQRLKDEETIAKDRGKKGEHEGPGMSRAEALARDNSMNLAKVPLEERVLWGLDTDPVRILVQGFQEARQTLNQTRILIDYLKANWQKVRDPHTLTAPHATRDPNYPGSIFDAKSGVEEFDRVNRLIRVPDEPAGFRDDGTPRSNKKYGPLTGKMIPVEDFAFIRGAEAFSTQGNVFQSITNYWKRIKTVLSPATAHRNALGSFGLFAPMLGTWIFDPATWPALKATLRDFAGRTKETPVDLRVAKEFGLTNNSDMNGDILNGIALMTRNQTELKPQGAREHIVGITQASNDAFKAVLALALLGPKHGINYLRGKAPGQTPSKPLPEPLEKLASRVRETLGEGSNVIESGRLHEALTHVFDTYPAAYYQAMDGMARVWVFRDKLRKAGIDLNRSPELVNNPKTMAKVKAIAEEVKAGMLDYGDLPGWAKWLRGSQRVGAGKGEAAIQFLLTRPFISYAVKAVEVGARFAGKNPWKVALVIHAMEALDAAARTRDEVSDEERKAFFEAQNPYMTGKFIPIAYRRNPVTGELTVDEMTVSALSIPFIELPQNDDPIARARAISETTTQNPLLKMGFDLLSASMSPTGRTLTGKTLSSSEDFAQRVTSEFLPAWFPGGANQVMLERARSGQPSLSGVRRTPGQAWLQSTLGQSIIQQEGAELSDSTAAGAKSNLDAKGTNIMNELVASGDWSDVTQALRTGKFSPAQLHVLATRGDATNPKAAATARLMYVAFAKQYLAAAQDTLGRWADTAALVRTGRRFDPKKSQALKWVKELQQIDPTKQVPDWVKTVNLINRIKDALGDVSVFDAQQQDKAAQDVMQGRHLDIRR